MADGDAEVFRHPFGVALDDEDDDRVKVTVVFPGLKKKLLKDEASNAKVDLKVDIRTLDLKLYMKTKDTGKSKDDKFRYHIKKLPDDVFPDKCYHKVKKDKVIVYLWKAKPRSWQRELADGLETAEDDEEESVKE